MPSDNHAFVKKTNDDVEEWMKQFYVPDAIPEVRNYSRWAWQEQERRHAAIEADLLDALEDAVIRMTNQLILLKCDEDFIKNETLKARVAIDKAKGIQP